MADQNKTENTNSFLRRLTMQGHPKIVWERHPVFCFVINTMTCFMRNHFLHLFVQYRQAVPSVHPSEENCEVKLSIRLSIWLLVKCYPEYAVTKLTKTSQDKLTCLVHAEYDIGSTNKLSFDKYLWECRPVTCIKKNRKWNWLSVSITDSGTGTSWIIHDNPFLTFRTL